MLSPEKGLSSPHFGAHESIGYEQNIIDVENSNLTSENSFMLRNLIKNSNRKNLMPSFGVLKESGWETATENSIVDVGNKKNNFTDNNVNVENTNMLQYNGNYRENRLVNEETNFIEEDSEFSYDNQVVDIDEYNNESSNYESLNQKYANTNSNEYSNETYNNVDRNPYYETSNDMHTEQIRIPFKYENDEVEEGDFDDNNIVDEYYEEIDEQQYHNDYDVINDQYPENIGDENIITTNGDIKDYEKSHEISNNLDYPASTNNVIDYDTSLVNEYNNADASHNVLQSNKRHDNSTNHKQMRFSWWDTYLSSNNNSDDIDTQKLSSNIPNGSLQVILLDNIRQAIEKNNKSSAFALIEALKVMNANINKEGKKKANDKEDVRILSSNKVDHAQTKKKKLLKKKKSDSVKEIKESIVTLTKLLTNNDPLLSSEKINSNNSLQTFNKLNSTTENSNIMQSYDDLSYSNLSVKANANEKISDKDELEIYKNREIEYENTIRELKELVNAQSIHVKNTIETLDSLENERQKAIENIKQYQENEKLKNEIILNLQNDYNTIVDQNYDSKKLISKYALEVTELKNELTAYKEKTIELLDKAEKKEKSMEETTVKLQTQNKQYENTINQLEADILEMIDCCKDYRQALQQLQSLYDKKINDKRKNTYSLKVGTVVNIPSKDLFKHNKGMQAVITIDNHSKSSKNYAIMLEAVQDEREQLEELLYLIINEHEAAKKDISKLNDAIVKKDEKILELEFMLECQNAYKQRINSNNYDEMHPNKQTNNYIKGNSKFADKCSQLTPEPVSKFRKKNVTFDDNNLVTNSVGECENTNQHQYSNAEVLTKNNIYNQPTIEKLPKFRLTKNIKKLNSEESSASTTGSISTLLTSSAESNSGNFWTGIVANLKSII